MMNSNKYLYYYLFLCILSSRGINGGCPFDCEPNGTCESGNVNVFCKCNAGYAGSDCSLPYEICADGYTKCYNGATCIRAVSNKDPDDPDGRSEEYECDCSQMPNGTPFEIAQCENPVEDVCEKGLTLSEHAFCTNAGTCIRRVEIGEQHPGCICTDQYEGRHCQYRKGEAPEAELALVQKDLKKGDGIQENPAGDVFLVILIVLLIFGGLWFAVMKRVQGLSEQRKEAAIQDAMGDLQLEDEGGEAQEGEEAATADGKGEMA